MGNTVIICSFADGWSRHENKSNLEFYLAFYMIPGIFRDSRDYEPQIFLPFRGPGKADDDSNRCNWTSAIA